MYYDDETTNNYLDEDELRLMHDILGRLILSNENNSDIIPELQSFIRVNTECNCIYEHVHTNWYKCKYCGKVMADSVVIVRNTD